MKYENKLTKAVIDLSCELHSDIWEPVTTQAPVTVEKVETKKTANKKAVQEDGE